MTQPPQDPGHPEPARNPDATQIRPGGTPRPGDQPLTPPPAQHGTGQSPPPWQPQPSPYVSGAQPPAPPPATTPNPSRRRTLLFVGVGVVVLGLLAGAVILFLSTGDTGAEVADLGRGDCVQSSAIADGSADVTNLEVVACDQAHDAEVVATGSVEDSEEPTEACLQAITDAGTSIAALAVEDREVRPLSSGDDFACLVVGDDLEGSILE